MNKLFLTLFYIVISNCGMAQEPAIVWQNMMGTIEEEQCIGATLTYDQSIVLAGQSASNISGDKTENSYGEKDFWVVKLDLEGNIIWDKTLGGDMDEQSARVAIASDGSYFIAGSSESGISGVKTEDSNGADDLWLLKLDELGEIIWQNTIGGNSADLLVDIKATPDNGLVALVMTASSISGDITNANNGGFECLVFKIDAFGEIQWQSSYGGNTMDYPSAIELTADGGYIIAATTISSLSGDVGEVNNGLEDMWILKLDVIGDLEWENVIGGSQVDAAYDVDQLMDGNYVIAGFSNSDISGDKTENSRGENDFWILCLDGSGEIVWQRTIGGSEYDQANYIFVKNNEIYVTGHSNSNISGEKTENTNGGYDVWTVALDASGNVLWQSTMGGFGTEQYFKLEPLDDGFVLTGASNSIISGDISENPIGTYDYLAMRLSTPLSIDENEVGPAILVYPNPLTEKLLIEYDQPLHYELTNIQCQETIQGTEKIIDFTNLAVGTYMLRIYNENDELISKNKVVKN